MREVAQGLVRRWPIGCRVPNGSSEGLGADDDLDLSERKIARHLRLIARLMDVKDILLQMESECGSKHPLIAMKALGVICGMTSVGNKNTSQALLKWTVQALFVLTMRGHIQHDISASNLKAKVNEVPCR